MDPAVTITVLFVLGVSLFVLTSPRLRNTVRSWFTGRQAQAADALDDAVDRMENAEAKNEAELAKANAGLIEVKSGRRRIEDEIAAAQADVIRYRTASENAAKAGRRDLVKAALERAVKAEARAASLQPLLKDLLVREEQVQTAVNKLMDRKASLKGQKVDIRTRARTAKVALGVNELLAGVDLSGQDNDVDRALEIVAGLEARAGAMHEVMEMATRDEEIDRELEALSRPISDISAEADALMARFAPPESPVDDSEDASEH